MTPKPLSAVTKPGRGFMVSSCSHQSHPHCLYTALRSGKCYLWIPFVKSSFSWCQRTKQGVALGILGHNLVLADKSRMILLSHPDTKSMARPSWKLPQRVRVGFKLQFFRQKRNCKFNWLEINHFRSHQTKITFFLSRKWNKNSFRKSTILYRKLAHRFFYKTQNFLLATSIRILFPVSFVYGTRQAV